MKKNSPKIPDTDDADTGAAARGMLRLAERNLARVLCELDATIAELEERGEGAGARAKGVTADVRKAIQTVFDERHRIDRLDEKNGETGGGGLDLDAARAEIGRRLARLKTRGGAEAVSEKPR